MILFSIFHQKRCKSLFCSEGTRTLVFENINPLSLVGTDSRSRPSRQNKRNVVGFVHWKKKSSTVGVSRWVVHLRRKWETVDKKTIEILQDIALEFFKILVLMDLHLTFLEGLQDWQSSLSLASLLN